jgi:large subunit ribosomal protein L18
MMKRIQKLKISRRRRRKRQIRKGIEGTVDRPRLTVYRSHKNIYVQAVDDLAQATIAEANSRSQDLGDDVGYGGNAKAAAAVGQLIARRLRMKGIDHVVFDRGGYKYHGRVKALAEAARAEGLKF